MTIRNRVLELEKELFKQINDKFLELGLEKGFYSIYAFKVSWNLHIVEIDGYDKIECDEFHFHYDYFI